MAEPPQEEHPFSSDESSSRFASLLKRTLSELQVTFEEETTSELFPASIRSAINAVMDPVWKQADASSFDQRSVVDALMMVSRLIEGVPTTKLRASCAAALVALQSPPSLSSRPKTTFDQRGMANFGIQQNANVMLNYAAAVPVPQVPPVILSQRAAPFVGREEDVAWVLQHLKGRVMGRVVTICGPGGIGKTAVAVEAMIRLTKQQDCATWYPDGIFYHSFYTTPSLAVAYEQVARLFQEELHGDAYQAAVRVLSRRRLLLVFDGVEVLEETRLLQELGGKSVLLFLSRRQSDAPDQAHRLDLGLLSQEHGITLLQQVAGSRATDRASVERLVQVIEGYPLALQLIGKYLTSRQEEVSEYLEQVEADRLHLLQHPELDQGEHESQSVRLVLQRSYASLSEEEQHILAVFGMLASAPVPLELLQPILAWPVPSLRKALGTLVNLSLLRRPERCYEVSHPLVHTFAAILTLSQGSIFPAPSPGTLATWRERVLTTLASRFAQQDPYNAIALALWQPHVLPLLVAEHLTDLQDWELERFGNAAHLFNMAGFYALTQGQYAEAEPLLKRALAMYEQGLGPIHPNVHISFLNLATLYRKQGKFAEAEQIYQEILPIWEHQLGPDHSEVASLLNNLANLYLEQGKYSEGEPLYQRALQIREKSLGPEHPEVAFTLDCLANLYLEQGKYKEAKPLYQRALQIEELHLGPEHPEVASTLNNLAILYSKQGKYKEAEPLYQRALQIREKRLRPEHPDVASTFDSLATLYIEQGKYKEAEPLYQRALQIREKSLGLEHPDVASTLNNLASLYNGQGKYKEGEPLYQRALQIKELHLGPEHPDVASTLNNLASVYTEQGKYKEAEPLYQRALQIRELRLGPEHPKVALPLNNLARLYLEQGKYIEAEPLLRRALQINELHLGPEHPATRVSRANYAVILRAMRPPIILGIWKRALKLFSK